jgi:hypothetical protein
MVEDHGPVRRERVRAWEDVVVDVDLADGAGQRAKARTSRKTTYGVPEVRRRRVRAHGPLLGRDRDGRVRDRDGREAAKCDVAQVRVERRVFVSQVRAVDGNREDWATRSAARPRWRDGHGVHGATSPSAAAEKNQGR